MKLNFFQLRKSIKDNNNTPAKINFRKPLY